MRRRDVRDGPATRLRIRCPPLLSTVPAMRSLHALVLVSLALLASGCGGDDQQATRAPESASSTPTATSKDGKSGLWFKPEALSACDTSALVTVHWNVGAGDAETVDVFTVRPGGEEAMFARNVRPAGMKRTGRWIRAGREFVVRGAHGAELARAAVGTLPCPAGQKAPETK
jgi:hypothetical protein